MKHLFHTLLVTTVVIFSPLTKADISLAAASVSSQMIMFTAASTHLFNDLASHDHELKVDRVEHHDRGATIFLTASGTATSALALETLAGSYTDPAALPVAGSLLTVTAVTISLASANDILIGHVISHDDNVLGFVPQHDLAIGLHSQAIEE